MRSVNLCLFSLVDTAVPLFVLFVLINCHIERY